MKRGGLGRGLDVLLPQNDHLLETVVRDIPIDEIDPNADQPRRDFDKEDLEQLAESIYCVQFASIPDFIVRMQAAKFIPHTDMERYPTIKEKLEKGDVRI